MCLITVVLILCTIFFVYLYVTWDFNYWKKRRVVGPKPRPFVGTFPKSTFSKKTYLVFEADEIFLKYYRNHRYIGIFEGVTPKIMVLDPELAKDILIKHFNTFSINSLALKINHNHLLLCRNPFCKNGEDWKAIRHEASQAVTPQKLKPMFTVIQKISNRMVEYIEKNKNESFHVKELANQFTIEVTADCVLGIGANAFENKDFLNNANKLYERSMKESILHILHITIPWIHKIVPNLVLNPNGMKWFLNVALESIDIRRNSDAKRDDIMNYFMELESKMKYTTEQTASNLFIAFADSFETTGFFLGNIIHLLATHQDVQERLRKEILSIGDVTEFEPINKLPYLNQVLNESLRVSLFLFPMWKKCEENIDIEDYDGSKLTIEKGMDVYIPMHSFHFHPDYFPNAEKFDPNRFDESKGGVRKFKEAGVLMPFGQGPRMCFGMPFAKMEIKTAIFELIKNFNIFSKEKLKTDEKVETIFVSDNLNNVAFERI